MHSDLPIASLNRQQTNAAVRRAGLNPVRGVNLFSLGSTLGLQPDDAQFAISVAAPVGVPPPQLCHKSSEGRGHASPLPHLAAVLNGDPSSSRPVVDMTSPNNMETNSALISLHICTFTSRSPSACSTASPKRREAQNAGKDKTCSSWRGNHGMIVNIAALCVGSSPNQLFLPLLPL
jgi:hypothetical protein